MAVYPFKCLDCGKEFEESHSMKKAPLKVPCKCGATAFRNWNAYGDVDAMMKENTRYSMSMGCNVNNIDKMEKMYPGSEYDNRGRLKVKNRQHKLKMLKQRDMVEY